MAILPLRNHSGGEVPEQLADGLHEAAVHMLAKFSDFRVVALSKMRPFGESGGDLAAIAAETGASHVVGGSLMVRDGVLKLRYRIAAAADGAVLVSGDLEHPGHDAFALLEDAPERLVVLLAHHLADIARRQALALDDSQLAAQDHFLIGVHHAFYASPIDYRAALDAFEQGLRRDPGHGPLNAFAAWAKAGLGLGLGENGRREALTQAQMAMAAGDSQSRAIAATCGEGAPAAPSARSGRGRLARSAPAPRRPRRVSAICAGQGSWHVLLVVAGRDRPSFRIAAQGPRSGRDGDRHRHRQRQRPRAT